MKAHVEDDIHRYFEGRLTAVAERDALFGHLDRCPECRAEFDAIAEADRLLADLSADALPPVQLDAIRASVLESAEVEKPSRAKWWLSWLVPAAAAAVALFAAMPSQRFTSKGGATVTVPTVEALCFDSDANVVQHLAASGTCPAPGFVKMIYASPESTPHLTVVARRGDAIVSRSSVEDVKPRSVLPEHVALAAGETIEVVVLTEPPADDEALKVAEPTLVITGVAR